MLQGIGRDIGGAAGLAAGQDHTARRLALAIGLLLGGAAVVIAQAALPALTSATQKTEDRLAASASTDAEDAAACTALVQDRVTGSTIAVGCGSLIPFPATPPLREIES